MRICLLCYRANPFCGGQGIYLKYVAEALARQGHEVHAIVGPPYPHHMDHVTIHYIENNQYYIKKSVECITYDNPFDIFHPINAYEYIHSRLGAFPEISGFSYRAFFMVRKLHEKLHFDVIHDNQCIGYGLLFMKALGIPVVATIHHPLTIDLENVLERASSFKNRMKGVMFYPILMQQIVSKRLDHIITVSEDSKHRITKDFGVPPHKQSVVYNGLDTSIFRKLPNIKKKHNKLLFVGNVEDGKKGFVYLLKALTLIQSDATLTVIDGGAPHRRITQKLVDTLGMRNKVEFVGAASTDELVHHYNEATIAIVPSVYEGFGFPAAEAMACGTPVIASDGGALREVVGDAGIVVSARDEVALANAIDNLLQNKKLLQELSHKGIKRVQTHFNWDNAALQMAAIYEKVISSYYR
ncbi:MAG TPA: glycosyltransferase family 4 protein [Spirochaetota bacterium]|nr:glycosyltransferase family 4 protein [Spirochaetota bacterium]